MLTEPASLLRYWRDLSLKTRQDGWCVRGLRVVFDGCELASTARHFSRASGVAAEFAGLRG